MGNWGRYTYILRYLVYLAILIDIVSRNMGNINYIIIYLTLFIIATINDYFRFNYFYNISAKIFYTSILISILIGAFLNFIIGGYINIYLYMILFDIAFISDKKVAKYLYIFNVFMLIFVPLQRIVFLDKIGIIQVFKENILDLIMFIVFLFFSTISLFSYRALILEKARVEKLNKEIEALTITKERSRVAQEIHDNLGHSLVALNMNLDVVSNILDKDIEKTKELINKCQNLAYDSMKNLRKAVYALRDEEISQGLIKSIEKLVYNIEDENNMKIHLNIDEEIESYSPEYKNLIYTTIKESVTNSIKHGKGDNVSIELKIEEEVILSIKDNGIGCNEIIKGNGLRGIEERANKFQGKTIYNSKKGQGFELILKCKREGF